MTSTDNHRRGEARPSIGDLVATLSEKVSALIRDEIQLAKAEMTAKARNAGIGAGMFVGAAVLGYFGLIVLIAAAVLGIAVALPAWLAALIVAAVLFGLAALLGVIGSKVMSKGKGEGEGASEVAHRAQMSIKADVAALKGSHPSTEGQS